MEPVTLHPQLPVNVLGPGSNTLQLSTAESSFLQNRTKSKLSSTSHLQEGMASSVLIPLSDVMVLEEVTSLLNPLNTWGATWVRLSEQQ